VYNLKVLNDNAKSHATSFTMVSIVDHATVDWIQTYAHEYGHLYHLPKGIGLRQLNEYIKSLNPAASWDNELAARATQLLVIKELSYPDPIKMVTWDLTSSSKAQLLAHSNSSKTKAIAKNILGALNAYT
jgi:hypothetical protein